MPSGPFDGGGKKVRGEFVSDFFLVVKEGQSILLPDLLVLSPSLAQR